MRRLIHRTSAMHLLTAGMRTSQLDCDFLAVAPAVVNTGAAPERVGLPRPVTDLRGGVQGVGVHGHAI